MKIRYHFLLALLILSVAPLLRASGLEDIQARGVLRIGICEFAPWSFTNNLGELEGFELDVGRQIALDMGVDAEFIVYNLEDIYDGLNNGEIDFVAAGLAITPERALLADFSSPYTVSGITFVVNKKEAKRVSHVEDLNQEGFRVITVKDTFSSRYASTLFDFAEVEYLPDERTATQEILTGRAQGYLLSLPEAKLLAHKYPKVIEMPQSEPLVGAVSGFAVRQGNYSVLHYLNAWVASRNADRWLHQTYAYWFNNFDWLERSGR